MTATIGLDSFGYHVCFTSGGRKPVRTYIPCESLEQAQAVATAFEGGKK